MFSALCRGQASDSLYRLYIKSRTLPEKTSYLILYADELRRFDVDSAGKCAGTALASAHELKDQLLIADASVVQGFCEETKGNYKAALQYFLSATDVYKKLKNKARLSKCYTGMGVIYWYQGFYDKAIDYYKKNISISLELNDKSGLAASYGNIAIILDERKDLDNALLYYNKALTLYIEENNQSNIAACYDNMSLIFKQKEDFKTALDYNIKSYKLRESLKDTLGMLASMENLGAIFIKLNKLDDAIAISQRVLNIAERLGAKEDMKFAFINLKEAYEAKKDYKMANAILNQLMAIKDSLRNIDNLNQIAELEAKFKTREKETELSEIKLIQRLKEKENTEKLKKKNYFIGIISIIGFFILIMAFLLFRRFREKKLMAEKLELKNQEIEKQKTIIDLAFGELTEKNKDITDSIKYAKRIQEAIFPSPALFLSLLPKSFVLFKPKDIVSGDFYWIEENADAVYLAVVDCTGHGVPGAFMSIVGFNLLNHAIREHKCNTPAQILNQVNRDLNETLKQKETENAVKDGMEISICKLDKKHKTLTFAGANTIIYHVTKQAETNVIKGNKHPIGSFYGEELKPFTDILVDVKPDDCVYLFSDGYADQFGGPKGKKFKYKQLEDLLLVNAGEPMIIQHARLNEAFEKWRGNLEQVDDVCVIGFRI